MGEGGAAAKSDTIGNYNILNCIFAVVLFFIILLLNLTCMKERPVATTSSSLHDNSPVIPVARSPVPTSLDEDIQRTRMPFPAPVVDDNDLIDDALLSAIHNPRERLMLLNCEHQILEFIKST
jgi:hypothetical protein